MNHAMHWIDIQRFFHELWYKWRVFDVFISRKWSNRLNLKILNVQIHHCYSTGYCLTKNDLIWLTDDASPIKTVKASNFKKQWINEIMCIFNLWLHKYLTCSYRFYMYYHNLFYYNLKFSYLKSSHNTDNIRTLIFHSALHQENKTSVAKCFYTM